MDSEALKKIIANVKKAEEKFSKYSQEEVDRIFYEVAKTAAENRLSLAQMAVDETGMGVFEDKVRKNHYAAEYIYNAFKDTRTCGVVEEYEDYGIVKLAEPVGVVAAVVPTTNPTSTVIFKVLIALKARCGIIISPHPRAKRCSVETAKILLLAAVKAGAPEGIIGWIDEPSVELSKMLMSEADIILATGGPQMVKAAYSSGKPAIGVGAGNTPAIIDETADITMAVSSIIHSKSFDNGVICASEQSVIVAKSIKDKVKAEFKKRGGFFAEGEDGEKLRNIIFRDGHLNADIVGQSAVKIANLAGIDVPQNTKLLLQEVEVYDTSEPLAHEKLSPVLAFYSYTDFEKALEIADTLIKDGGYGHTSSIYINENTATERLKAFQSRMKTCRILVNTPASQGAIGDVYNFMLSPSMTLGCGSWGGNSVADNVGVMHLVNIKTVAKRRENMLWMRFPEKLYIKSGCLDGAIAELGEEYGRKRAFIVTDKFLFDNGYTKAVTEKLRSMGIIYTTFFDVTPDPTLETAKKGVCMMKEFEPDVIIAIGGGSPMDAAKIMWVMYEHQDVNFADMALRFADIRKRIYKFPKMGERAMLVAIPTSSGTGSEVTPFAVITDEKTGIKYPLADYELLPDMAIVDSDLTMNMPKSLTAASGIDALIHSVESYASMLATDYTDSLAEKATAMVIKYLPIAYNEGTNKLAREKMANAATMAGMAFANAFLGLCHSMAHKLGSFFHLPHGVANALLIGYVIEFNSEEAPFKMGTFPQYTHPNMLQKYAKLAEYVGIEGENDREKLNGLIKKIDDLKGTIGIKPTIKDYGIDEKEFLKELDKMSLQAFDDQCTGANPRYPRVEEIKEIYKKAYYGN